LDGAQTRDGSQFLEERLARRGGEEDGRVAVAQLEPEVGPPDPAEPGHGVEARVEVAVVAGRGQRQIGAEDVVGGQRVQVDAAEKGSRQPEGVEVVQFVVLVARVNVVDAALLPPVALVAQLLEQLVGEEARHLQVRQLLVKRFPGRVQVQGG
jgi:hypothetical protein